jgi:hypothetical protein
MSAGIRIYLLRSTGLIIKTPNSASNRPIPPGPVAGIGNGCVGVGVGVGSVVGVAVGSGVDVGVLVGV